MPRTGNLFDLEPLVIGVIQLPEVGIGHKPVSIAWLEDYVLRNLEVFAGGGIAAVILQDETLNASQARPENVAIMASLARLARAEFPELHFGIIFQAHDPLAALAVAYASGASFVRI